MGAYRIRYEGPSSLAVRAATMLAEAEGVKLTSSQPPERRPGPVEVAVLALTLEGAPGAVMDAVEVVRGRLPADVTITIEDG